MQLEGIGRVFDEGEVGFADRKPRSIESEVWHPHPAFSGVYLKHLIRGKDTEGVLSCHLVRVEPGSGLRAHRHDGQWELHEVLDGLGQARLGFTSIAYRPGVQAVIPRGLEHELQAGDRGLTVLAKFFPALL